MVIGPGFLWILVLAMVVGFDFCSVESRKYAVSGSGGFGVGSGSGMAEVKD